MVTMTQSSAQHAHSQWIARIHSHTYINAVTSTTTLCEAPAQLLHNLEYNYITTVPEGGGANRSEYPGENPRWNPRPLTLGINSLGL